VHIGTWHFTLNYTELHLFCPTIDRDINIKLLILNAIHDAIFINYYFRYVKLLFIISVIATN